LIFRYWNEWLHNDKYHSPSEVILKINKENMFTHIKHFVKKNLTQFRLEKTKYTEILSS
jgi:hypothetical protein